VKINLLFALNQLTAKQQPYHSLGDLLGVLPVVEGTKPHQWDAVGAHPGILCQHKDSGQPKCLLDSLIES
jgi:hypothetical protein